MKLYLFDNADGEQGPLWGTSVDDRAAFPEWLIAARKADLLVPEALHYVDADESFILPLATVSGGTIISVAESPPTPPPLLVTVGLTMNGSPVVGGEVAVEQNAAVTLKLVVTVSNGFTGAHGMPVMIRGVKDVKRLTFTAGVCEMPISTALAVGEYEMNAEDILKYLSVQHPSTSLVVTGKAWISIWPET
jgi:hypothetical protein